MKQERDADVLFRYFKRNSDGTPGDPYYLTVDGLSGSTKLSIAASLKQYPEDTDAVLELATAVDPGGLTVLDAPNDNQLVWHSDFTKIDFDSGCYYMDIVALISDSSRLDLGTLTVTFRPRVTEVPVP